MRYYATALTAALALSATLSGPAARAQESGVQAPPAITGSCTFKKTEFTTGIGEQTTTSTTFVNMGDAGAITFNQKKTGCVAGIFFANAGNTTSGDNVHLQVLLDGSACAPVNTGDYVFANGDVDFSSHAVGFLCSTNAAPGSHTVQVQWSVGVGGEAAMFQHTLEVSHL